MAGPIDKRALVLVALSGVIGSAGVSLAAIAAHKVESPALVTAANMLMIHAAAGTGIAAVALQNRAGGWIVSGILMLAAVALFAGDITLHALTGGHLFPYAAPTGGTLTIVSWIVLSFVSLRSLWRLR